MECFKVLNLKSKLHDDWRLLNDAEAPRSRAQVFFHGRLSWTALQVMITKSTVTDFLQMGSRLKQFFEQEFISGKRMLLLGIGTNSTAAARREKDAASIVGSQENIDANAGGAESGASGAGKAANSAAAGQKFHLRHHRHWQKSLDMIAHLMLALRFPFLKEGVSLGGILEFVGDEIGLACFHGTDFRSHLWALFHLRNPVHNLSRVRFTLGVERTREEDGVERTREEEGRKGETRRG